MAEYLLELKDVVKEFPMRSGFFERNRKAVYAVRGVSLGIRRGETLGLVGESGCGKSTLAMLILKLISVDRGSILFDGQDITHFSDENMKPIRRQMQIVFQDPYASLNPRMKIGSILEEPLIIHKTGDRQARRARVDELLDLVGISRQDAGKYPHEFSGGQRQRIGIARALALKPKLIIADEPVSALDVSIRGEIINLLLALQKEFGLSYLFISHDLKLVEHVSHEVVVMYMGKIMESVSASELSLARHPYTQALLSAVPKIIPGGGGRRIVLSGDVPSPIHPPSGCPFHTRCQYAQAVCKDKEPPFEAFREKHFASCHFIREMVPLAEEGT